MHNLCLRGGIRTTEFGTPSVYLFPIPGEGPRDFKHLESDALKGVLTDHFNFFRSGEVQGKVHGRSVSVTRTRGKEQRKIMRFSAGFMDFTFLEDTKSGDDSKAILFIELPFHDPTAARQADANRGDG